jgi:hypothetical protein
MNASPNRGRALAVRHLGGQVGAAAQPGAASPEEQDEALEHTREDARSGTRPAFCPPQRVREPCALGDADSEILKIQIPAHNDREVEQILWHNGVRLLGLHG